MEENEKQNKLADRYHTCTCDERYFSIKWETTRIVDADFENSNLPRFQGRRMLWGVSKCGNCTGDILHGTCFTDYRVTGDDLLANATKEAQLWVGDLQDEALKNKLDWFGKALQQIWEKYQKYAVRGNVCEGCGDDLTKPGSVARTYLVKGQYDEKGYFNNTGGMNSTDDPDICTNCGNAIMSTNYPELDKALEAKP